VLLAAVGIFGVVARAVAHRSHELAIRAALGAESGSLRRLVLGRTLLAGGIGIGAGLIFAMIGSHYINTYLFGIRSTDPFTYSIVGSAVLFLCLMAGYLPTRRLLLLHPAKVLKED